jgi:hypothetical protein
MSSETRATVRFTALARKPVAAAMATAVTENRASSKALAGDFGAAATALRVYERAVAGIAGAPGSGITRATAAPTAS